MNANASPIATPLIAAQAHREIELRPLRRARSSPGGPNSSPESRKTRARAPRASHHAPRYRLQRSSTAPTVNPAPTEAEQHEIALLQPCPGARASASASGIVPAVVLPYISRLMIDLVAGRGRGARRPPR